MIGRTPSDSERKEPREPFPQVPGGGMAVGLKAAASAPNAGSSHPRPSCHRTLLARMATPRGSKSTSGSTRCASTMRGGTHART